MRLKIHINRILCTGCLVCELVCSVNKTGCANPLNSRIRVTKIPEEGLFGPVVCRQCNPAPCIHQCPVSALQQDSHTNAILVNRDLCIECRTCIEACPFGAIQYFEGKGIIICDLCGGDPTCVKYCKERPENSSAFMANPRACALQFTESQEFVSNKRLVNLRKKRDFAS